MAKIPPSIESIKKAITAVAAEATNLSPAGIVTLNITIEIPPDETMGDLAFPCFSLAKELKKSPQQIASDITVSIKKLPKGIAAVRAMGPYVNFFLSPLIIAEIVLSNEGRKKTTASKRIATKASKEALKNKAPKKNKGRILIEYVSPNTNKPLHLGHARNGVLGDCIARMHEYLGSGVARTLLINDRGIHICKSMVAYELKNQELRIKNNSRLTPKSEGVKGDHFVGDYYVLYEKLLKEDPTIEDRARECLKKWEAGDKKTCALWKTMNSWTLAGMRETTKRLGFTFDKTYYESDIYTSGREIILQGLKDGVFKKDETGAVYADLEPFGLPNKILLRRDGTTLYITQDIFLAMKKWADFKPTTSIYVVGSEQDLYLKQLFAVLKLLKVPYADHLVHLSYGMVRLPEGKMKSREGTVVDADDLIDELVVLVTKEIRAREKDLSAREVKKRSETIALAALKYYLLAVGPSSDMIFNPKESIALHGKTGPYLLYAYARLRSITRKNKELRIKNLGGQQKNMYEYQSEKALLLALIYFKETVGKAVTTTNPSLLANYLHDLAKKTNDYYHTTRVLDAPEPARAARLLLMGKIADTLKAGLGLLGIQTIEKM